ncbi:thioredoxin reductase 3-like [Scleropages formosus]|uniref:Thioredoxin reductase 3-like n=1 Tax=Scleropages formosus TaxID=113540 RepID=A0A0P7U068_SCLFO|nr:thioredoxin reductase 3-like [Scleropages formosus]
MKDSNDQEVSNPQTPGRRGGTQPGVKNGEELVKQFLRQSNVVIFTMTSCTRSTQVTDILATMGVPHVCVELDKRGDKWEIQHGLWVLTQQRELPFVFVDGKYFGGAEKFVQAQRDGTLNEILRRGLRYDYDLVVIGGGLGGLAAAKEAASFGKNVLVLNFGGLGGTCINVGCIAKKLMHQAALLGQAIQDSSNFGWEFNQQVSHNWTCMMEAVQLHIKAMNCSHHKQHLQDSRVTYLNALGELVAPHTVKTTDTKGAAMCHSAAVFIISTGESPRYLGIPGDREFCITSDDLFSLPHCPGHTLVVGASYMGLECAGFLAGLGLPVTVMVRSILLRGFDQKIAERIEEHMVNQRISFLRPFVLTKVEKIQEGSPGKLRVTALSSDGKETFEGEFNTVLLAIGREACTRNIGLDHCDYINVPTMLFTSMEYGACGVSEERASQMYGEENIEVYHSNFWPLEWTVPGRDKYACYAKVICHIPDSVSKPSAGLLKNGYCS